MTEPALATLRDIHLPPPPGPGWWSPNLWLVLFVVAAAAFAVHRYRRRLLRAALGELRSAAASHAQSGDAVRLASDLSRLLRRYALAKYPGSSVAGLQGVPWLAFLDARGGGGAFSSGAGRVLESLPYCRSGQVDAQALIALTERWLRANG